MDAEYIFFMHFMGRVDEARQQPHRRSSARHPARRRKLGALPGSGRASLEHDRGLLRDEARRPPGRHIRRSRRRAASSSSAAASPRRACSRASSSPTSASFPGTAYRRCRSSSCLLPSWFPINIYEMSSWARGTVVPLAVLMAKCPYMPIAPERGVAELWLEPPTLADYAFPRSPAAALVAELLPRTRPGAQARSARSP